MEVESAWRKIWREVTERHFPAKIWVVKDLTFGGRYTRVILYLFLRGFQNGAADGKAVVEEVQQHKQSQKQAR